jgi:hypothetical protein
VGLKLFSDIQSVWQKYRSGPSFFEEPHFKYYIYYFEASILEIHRTELVGQSIFFARTERKVWREKLLIFQDAFLLLVPVIYSCHQCIVRYTAGIRMIILHIVPYDILHIVQYK